MFSGSMLCSRSIEEVMLQHSTELMMCSDFTPTSASQSPSVTVGLRVFCDTVKLCSLSGNRGHPSLSCRVIVRFLSPCDILFRRILNFSATCVPPSVIVSSCRASDKMTVGDCTASAGSRDIKPTLEEFCVCVSFPSTDSATVVCWSCSCTVTGSDVYLSHFR